MPPAKLTSMFANANINDGDDNEGSSGNIHQHISMVVDEERTNKVPKKRYRTTPFPSRENSTIIASSSSSSSSSPSQSNHSDDDNNNNAIATTTTTTTTTNNYADILSSDSSLTTLSDSSLISIVSEENQSFSFATARSTLILQLRPDSDHGSDSSISFLDLDSVTEDEDGSVFSTHHRTAEEPLGPLPTLTTYHFNGPIEIEGQNNSNYNRPRNFNAIDYFWANDEESQDSEDENYNPFASARRRARHHQQQEDDFHLEHQYHLREYQRTGDPEHLFELKLLDFIRQDRERRSRRRKQILERIRLRAARGEQFVPSFFTEDYEPSFYHALERAINSGDGDASPFESVNNAPELVSYHDEGDEDSEIIGLPELIGAPEIIPGDFRHNHIRHVGDVIVEIRSIQDFSNSGSDSLEEFYNEQQSLLSPPPSYHNHPEMLLPEIYDRIQLTEEYYDQVHLATRTYLINLAIYYQVHTRDCFHDVLNEFYPALVVKFRGPSSTRFPNFDHLSMTSDEHDFKIFFEMAYSYRFRETIERTHYYTRHKYQSETPEEYECWLITRLCQDTLYSLPRADELQEDSFVLGGLSYLETILDESVGYTGPPSTKKQNKFKKLIKQGYKKAKFGLKFVGNAIASQY